MDQMDQLHNEHMTKLTTNMENLTNSITSGFALLQNLMYAPLQQHVYQQTGYGNFNPTWQDSHGVSYHFSDYHNGHSARSSVVGGAYSQLTDPPGAYRESTSDQ